MPNYDYECQECGHTKDALVSIADRDNKRVCENWNCGGDMRRVIHGVAIFIMPYEGFMPQEQKDPAISSHSAHRRYKLKPGQGMVEDIACRV